MKLGFSLWGFYYRQDPESWLTLPKAVKTVLAYDGNLGVEVWGSKGLDQPPVEGKELIDLAEACHQAEFTTIHVQGRHWSWDPNSLRHEIDFAHQLGAGTLILHPSCFGLVEEDDRPDWPEIVRITEYAAKFGVMLAMESMKNSIWTLDRILDEIGDDPEETNLGICIDIGHANQSNDAGRDPITNYLERYASQLIHLHLHDNDGERDEHLLPGEGNIDWPRVLGVLEGIGFAGTAVLEAHQPGVAPKTCLKRGIKFFR